VPVGSGNAVAVDAREQLANRGDVGPISAVSLPVEMITSLRGIMLDLDPQLIRAGILSKQARKDPKVFYESFVQPFLLRHPVLKRAEVRASGNGLHVLIWFVEPIQFSSESERQRWDGIVRAVQRVLPTDPNCPGITAMTRPLGSINGKNGAKVSCLHKGDPVAASEVERLFDEIRATPFRTISRILLGAEQLTPCPICKGSNNTLVVLDQVGHCYGTCGKVKLGQLYDVFMAPRFANGKAANHA
jgi:hypothetical protein